MKTKTVYISNSGVQFETEEEAQFEDSVYALALRLNQELDCIGPDDAKELAAYFLKNFRLIPK